MSTNPGTSNTIRVIPPGGVQDRATPRTGYSTVPRGGRDSGRTYSIPQAPAVTTVPRRTESPSPAPVVREAVPRARPQVQYAPHEYARPGTMAVPRAAEPGAARVRSAARGAARGFSSTAAIGLATTAPAIGLAIAPAIGFATAAGRSSGSAGRLVLVQPRLFVPAWRWAPAVTWLDISFA